MPDKTVVPLPSWISVHRFILRRVLELIVVALAVITVVFFVLRAVGDPARLLVAPEGTREDLKRVRQILGLHRPLVVQYLDYLGGVFTGNLGTSFRYGRPVWPLLLERLPATLLLSGATLLIAVPLGLGLGVLAGLRPNSFLDQVATAIAVAGRSMPSFWLGLVLIIFFAVYLNVLPPSGYGNLNSVILPAVTLAAWLVAGISRLTRAHMIEVLHADYVRTARAKGLSETRVVLRHGLRNVMIPVVTLMGLQVGRLLGGAIVVETVFAWPGVGRLLVEALFEFDFPVVQAAAMFIALTVVTANLVVDMTYAFLDPRIRAQ
jgi:peptide/nickel transport system permease protein